MAKGNRPCRGEERRKAIRKTALGATDAKSVCPDAPVDAPVPFAARAVAVGVRPLAAFVSEAKPLLREVGCPGSPVSRAVAMDGRAKKIRRTTVRILAHRGACE